jgi:hypothetical protein
MQYLPYLLVLACPVGMGIMMWIMMRGKPSSTAPQQPDQQTRQQAEIALLRDEIAQLRREQTPQPSDTTSRPTLP